MVTPGEAEPPALIACLNDPAALRSAAEAAGTTYPRPILRALMFFAAFPSDGTERGLAEVADELNLGMASAGLYAWTWVQLAALEVDHSTATFRRRHS